MTTKTRESRSLTVPYYGWDRPYGSPTHKAQGFTYQTGSDSITYSDGRKKPNGQWPWKSCDHVEQLHVLSPYFGYIAEWGRRVSGSYKGPYSYYLHATYVPAASAMLKLPSPEWDASVLDGILGQLDLNTSNAVLLYSGVLQAIPLLGGVFKLNSILRKVSDHISKSLRRKPFTTVIKDMISADFIDRFVISPTLDDARKFQQATDYVLNVIQTARERSSRTFALSSEVTTLVDSKEISVSNGQGGVGTVYGSAVFQSKSTSKAFMLLDAKYDIDAVSPLKVWAQRVGLTRPLDSVWDLVPFSFVVDYFTRAGDFISRLSDEMSTVEGLQGRITAIHDMWRTVNVSSTCTVTGTSSQINSHANSVQIQEGTSFAPGKAVTRTSRFVRSRVGNPWGYLLQRQERLSDYLTINLNPSSTKKRTIAELVIQAKL